MECEEGVFTVGELAGDKLESLIQDNDWYGDLEHSHPLLQTERCDLEYDLHQTNNSKSVFFSFSTKYNNLYKNVSLSVSKINALHTKDYKTDSQQYKKH